jgi:hypothetical protein
MNNQTSNIIEVIFILKTHSLFKTENKSFKINNQTSWKQVYDTLIQQEGEYYNFVSNGKIISLNDKIYDSLEQGKVYGISGFSSNYNIDDLIFLADTLLNN